MTPIPLRVYTSFIHSLVAPAYIGLKPKNPWALIGPVSPLIAPVTAVQVRDAVLCTYNRIAL